MTQFISWTKIAPTSNHRVPNLITLVQLIASFRSAHENTCCFYFPAGDTAKVRFPAISLPFTVRINHGGVSVIRKFTC